MERTSTCSTKEISSSKTSGWCSRSCADWAGPGLIRKRLNKKSNAVVTTQQGSLRHMAACSGMATNRQSASRPSVLAMCLPHQEMYDPSRQLLCLRECKFMREMNKTLVIIKESQRTGWSLLYGILLVELINGELQICWRNDLTKKKTDNTDEKP